MEFYFLGYYYVFRIKPFFLARSSNFYLLKSEKQKTIISQNCTENVPTKTCEDNFLIITKSNSTKITQEQNCVFIEAPYENLTQTTDEYLFKVLGIKN